MNVTITILKRQIVRIVLLIRERLYPNTVLEKAGFKTVGIVAPRVIKNHELLQIKCHSNVSDNFVILFQSGISGC